MQIKQKKNKTQQFLKLLIEKKGLPLTAITASHILDIVYTKDLM